MLTKVDHVLICLIFGSMCSIYCIKSLHLVHYMHKKFPSVKGRPLLSC